MNAARLRPCVTPSAQSVSEMASLSRAAFNAAIMLHRPTVEFVMEPGVLGRGEHFEVFWAIVRANLIFVVDVLFRRNLSPDRLFRHKPVLWNVAVAIPYPDITVIVDLLFRARRQPFAPSAAKFRRRKSITINLEWLAALNAGDDDCRRAGSVAASRRAIFRSTIPYAIPGNQERLTAIPANTRDFGRIGLRHLRASSTGLRVSP